MSLWEFLLARSSQLFHQLQQGVPMPKYHWNSLSVEAIQVVEVFS